jgi:hypothetical protein
VITEDEVLRLLERADPARLAVAPPAADAASYLDALRRRSTTVTLIDTKPTPTRPRHHRWPIVAAAAAAALAAVVGGLVLTASEDEPEAPTGPPTSTVDTAPATAQQIARDFLAAYGAFDVDQALSSLTDEALADLSATPGQPNARAEFRLALALLEGQGYQQTITGCEASTGSSSATTVRCSYDFHGIRSDEMGLGPYSGNSWELTVHDGKIVAATNKIAFATNGFSDQVWEPFAEWIATTYPDDVASMYTEGQTNFRLTEQSVQLWQQRSREYVDSRVGFVGLPPVGARSSNPIPAQELRHGEWCEPAIQAPDFCVNEANPRPNEFWLFSDGRLIWYFVGDLPEGANPLFTGLLEQRLTPQGVEYFRTEYADLEAGPSLPAANHDGLVERLRDPSNWPSGTWADPAIRPYIPATYGVTFYREGPTLGAEVLAVLPPAAQDLLRERNWSENRNGTAAFWGTSITSDEVRTLVDILEDAAVASGPEEYQDRLSYRFVDASGSATVHLDISPNVR